MDSLKRKGGVNVPGLEPDEKVSCLLFADDLVLLAEDDFEMNEMIVLRTSPNGRCFIKATNEKPYSGGAGVTQTPLSMTDCHELIKSAPCPDQGQGVVQA